MPPFFSGYSPHVVSERLQDRHPYVENFADNLKPDEINSCFSDREIPRFIEQLENITTIPLSEGQVCEILELLRERASFPRDKLKIAQSVAVLQSLISATSRSPVLIKACQLITSLATTRNISEMIAQNTVIIDGLINVASSSPDMYSEAAARALLSITEFILIPSILPHVIGVILSNNVDPKTLNLLFEISSFFCVDTLAVEPFIGRDLLRLAVDRLLESKGARNFLTKLGLVSHEGRMEMLENTEIVDCCVRFLGDRAANNSTELIPVLKLLGILAIEKEGKHAIATKGTLSMVGLARDLMPATEPSDRMDETYQTNQSPILNQFISITRSLSEHRTFLNRFTLEISNRPDILTCCLGLPALVPLGAEILKDDQLTLISALQGFEGLLQAAGDKVETHDIRVASASPYTQSLTSPAEFASQNCPWIREMLLEISLRQNNTGIVARRCLHLLEGS